ncbi:TetR/AcrR family transcriptional regulator [Zhihengliuella halotolerans]|uniref:TetR/AcrR family transcriptional regulator n=1 Tax=Zhihengliuella halotolerans TaxID=370736 RepID=UPI000C80BCF0|nr:TetR family transcriptional regulator [Zhihengliuella halotolerans]
MSDKRTKARRTAHSPRPGGAGDARRDALLQAAVRVVIREGATGASVRAIAEEASVSPGSVLYYYDGVDDLVNRALEAVMDRFHDRRLKVVAGGRSPVEKLAEMIRLGVPDDVGDELRSVYESIGTARTRPETLRMHRQVVERQVTLYRSLLEVGTESGDFAPQHDVGLIARNLVALEDAYDLYPQLGLSLTGAERRAGVRAYAELALQCTLPG